MIAFASLFLGLVLGTEPVEVVVGEGVAAVELRLDGTSVGTLEGPPWVRDCDFGSELAPRILEAVARDAAGQEVGRVSQWINLPQPRAVLSAALEPRETGAPRVVRLSWESIAGAEPQAVTATLDGAALAVDDPHRLVLPAVDQRQLHLLHVEMRFEGWVTSQVDLTFGGAYADQVATEITALPLLAVGKSPRPLTVDALQGWFREDGEPIRVLAVERGIAEVVIVLGRPFPHFLAPGERYKPPKSLQLAADQRVRFLTPVPRQSQGVTSTFELFPTSPPYDRKVGDLYTLLTHIMRPAEKRPPRLASAVAVAGLAAYEGRHRRAVVLVPDTAPSEDEIAPAQARRYLERLHVPFFIWDPERQAAPHVAAWGGQVERASDLDHLGEAFRALGEELDRQWIVWLDGRHLPQAVTLAPEAEGYALPR